MIKMIWQFCRWDIASQHTMWNHSRSRVQLHRKSNRRAQGMDSLPCGGPGIFFAVCFNPSKHLDLTMHLLNIFSSSWLGIFVQIFFFQILGKKVMISHWEYSRISAIKWEEKKLCRSSIYRLGEQLWWSD